MFKKTIATLALLAAMTAPALANNCVVYSAQLGSIASSLSYENSNMTKYTAMIDAATSVNDFNSAKMYASMGKDAVIRVTGLSADFKRILADVRKIPGNCGAGEKDMRSAEESMNVLDKATAEALKAFATIPQ